MRQLTQFAIFATCLAFPNSLIAATLYVDDDICPNVGTGTLADPYCSLQTAIDDAVDGDEILVAPGTYNEIIDFTGKAVALRGTAGTATTTIDATTVPDPGAGKPVVRCDKNEGPDTILDGFTITGGTGDTTDEVTKLSHGGGMYIHGSNPTVTNCTFVDNSVTGYGGGIYIDSASPLVADCGFAQNSAVFGGGMFNTNSSHSTVERCTFDDNTAKFGGGMFNRESHPTVTDSIFIRNTADFSTGGGGGGGMSNTDASEPIVTNCTFRDNSAFNGGGMHNYNFSAPTVTNCTFSGNSALFVGGGMTNCIFTGNTTFSDGGGMYNHVGNPTVTNCTFYANQVGRDGGGVFNNSGDPTVTNCILWNNADAGGADETAQIHTNAGTPIVNYSNVQGGWTGAGGTGNINADPLFADPDGPDNLPGTADDDLRLSAGSPCIDAGDNDAVPIGVTTDLTGNPRFVDSLVTPDTGNGTPPIVDMGAFEAPATVPADVDLDGDVDGTDFAFFAACFNKSDNPPRGGCSPDQIAAFDFDRDNDIDGVDFAAFASCFNKAGNPPRTLGCPQN